MDVKVVLVENKKILFEGKGLEALKEVDGILSK